MHCVHPVTRSAVASSASAPAEPVGFVVDSERVVVHHESVTEVPATLRLRVKRGDPDVDIF